MINIKIKYFFLFNFFLTFQFYGQSNLLNAVDPNEIGVKTASQLDRDDESYLEYGYVDDKDILWSKVVWEYIDLDEKVNFPLLYPTRFELVGKERRPLLWHLIEGIKDFKITKIYSDGKFNTLITKEEVTDKLNYSVIKKIGRDTISNAGGYISYLKNKGVDMGEYENVDINALARTDRFAAATLREEWKNLAIPILQRDGIRGAVSVTPFSYDMVVGYRVKGLWYFDKIQSDLRYRLLAIAPVTQQTSLKEIERNLNEDDWNTVPLFWVYYPDAREVLESSYLFSERNSSVRKSFDELLNKRRFNSTIYLEENTQEDREVSQYISKNAFMQLLESERIKEKIRNFEHDMWSW